MSYTQTAPPPIVAKLGGKQGIIDGAIPPMVFIVTNAVAGLLGAARPLVWAIALALTSGLAIVAARRTTGGTLKGATRGLVGLGVALTFATSSGQARDFFLPGIVVDAAYGVVFLASALLARPLVGYLYAAVFGRYRDWRRRPRLRRAFVVLTLGWSVVFAIRASAQAYLYVVDQPELLGLAKVALGWPLTALALAATLTVVRRASDCPA